MNIQNIYQNKIGKAKINIKKAIAGSKINCQLTYTVGELGIDESGSLKILFRIVSDCGELQFENEENDNYLKISSTNKNLKIIPYGKSTGLIGKIHERPWSKGIIVYFFGDYLKENDKIFFYFKNWRVQTFCEKKFQFKILVDPFATGRYISLPHSPHIEIIPDKPIKLVILAKTKTEINKKMQLLFKLEDQWGNPSFNSPESIIVINKNKYFKETKNKELKLKIKKGKLLALLTPIKIGKTYISAKYNNHEYISNPIVIEEKVDFFNFWADLHGQSEETVGTNDINNYFNFAKQWGFLDVASIQPNDFQVTNQFWKKINAVSKKFNKNGVFIVFPGYEWSGNTDKGGDRNIIYLEENQPLYRSSHALLNNFNDLENDCVNVEDLFKKLNFKKTIVIPHVGGRYADIIKYYNSYLEPLLEIHSDWGTFEWFLFEALKRKYKIGVCAGSDCHEGRLGASYPTYDHFNNIGGLTCILAKKLTREEIFKAIKKRHTYATTGKRIYLDVKCYSTNNEFLGMMGDQIKQNKEGKIFIKINCFTTSSLDRIEIYHNTKILDYYFPKIENKKQKAIKILWSGSKTKGRDREFFWEGSLISLNKIVRIEKINFWPKHRLIFNKDKNLLSWKGSTTGGTQGLILIFSKIEGEIKIKINGKNLGLNIKEIGLRPKTFQMGGLDAKLEIYETSTTDSPQEISFNLTVPKFNKQKVNPVFVKIIQRDGHLAWSSPIFFINPNSI
jgi:hypothetical protein